MILGGFRARDARPSDIAAAAILAVALVVFLVHEARTGLIFPVPWSDEASFLWPALSFRDGLGLFAPEVNPERDVLWMPPAFMVLHGLVFTVVPFSLEAARAVSAALMATAAAAVGAMAWPLRARLAHVLAIAAFLAAPVILLAGNTARMESLVLALATSGFFLLSRGRTAGLGVLALAPLAHPNGLFALLGGFVQAGLVTGSAWSSRRASAASRGVAPRPWLTLRVADGLVLVAVVACWTLYGVYVARHFADFKADMMAQLRFKMFISYADKENLGVRLGQTPIVIGLVALLLGGALAWRRRTNVLALFVLGVCMFVQTGTAAGWLYEVYPVLALLIATIVVVESAATLLADRVSARYWPWAMAALGVLGASLLVIAARNEFLLRTVERSTVTLDGKGPEYITAEDRADIGAHLRALAHERGRAAVQFLPAGEGLAYESLRGPDLGIVEQTFYVGKFDVLLVHDSVWCPQMIHDLELLRFITLPGVPIPKPSRIRSRDGTEHWSIYRFPPVPRRQSRRSFF